MPRTLFIPAGAGKESDSKLPAEKLKYKLGARTILSEQCQCLIFHIFHFNYFYFDNMVGE